MTNDMSSFRITVGHSRVQNFIPVFLAFGILSGIYSILHFSESRKKGYMLAKRAPVNAKAPVFEMKAQSINLCSETFGAPMKFPRIWLPTVPRSGNTISRFLLENLTDISTESVYQDEGTTYSNRSGAYGRDCGHIGYCDRIHRSTKDQLVIIKTHFPFMHPEFDENDCVSRILMTIRHPVDNYLAWAYYKGNGEKNTLDFRKQNFRDFYKLWQIHHTYWHAFASRRQIPLLQFRYEDLCRSPETVFSRVSAFLSLPFKGEYSASSKFKDCFLRNRIKPKSSTLIIQDDLDMVAKSGSYLLDLFDYRDPLSVDSLLVESSNAIVETLKL